MNFKNVLIDALGTIQNGTTFRRSDVCQHLMGIGYSERTASNAMTPSSKGSLVNKLLIDGAIEQHGPRGYRIVDNSKIEAPARKNANRMICYEGKPRDGWPDLAWVSCGDYECDFKMCGERYADGCWNLKVYAIGSMPRKANYWLQWRNGSLFGQDSATMKAHMPKLYQGVMEEMLEIEGA